MNAWTPRECLRIDIAMGDVSLEMCVQRFSASPPIRSISSETEPGDVSEALSKFVAALVHYSRKVELYGSLTNRGR